MTYLKPFLVGFLATFLIFGLDSALAASDQAGKIDDAIANRNLESLRSLMTQGAGAVDDAVKALLKSVQGSLKTDPDYAQKQISFAASYAPQISPPSVPTVCAEMRRIVEELGANEVGTPLFTSVMNAAQSFANAPVVVAAGRPNLCEEAWLQEALLAQTQNPAHQKHIKPIPPPPIPPSAD